MEIEVTWASFDLKHKLVVAIIYQGLIIKINVYYLLSRIKA